MVARGDDVTGHLSTLMLEAGYHDALLNDWGVHHFHLGTAPHPTKPTFAARTGPLLFARVTDTDFHALGVFPHSAFGDSEVVEILHREWPDTVRRYRINAIDIDPVPTNAEIKMLRKAGVTFFMKTSDGTIYAPPGGGYMTSGHSTQAVRHCDMIMGRLRQAAEQVAAAHAEIAAAFASGAPSELRYRLVLRGSDLYARGEHAPTIELEPAGF